MPARFLNNSRHPRLSLREFAAQTRVDAQRPYRWRTQLARGGRPPAFIEAGR
jgi:hypothetical protein